MGHNVSTVHGVKSDNFYQQGNAINEIWIGDLELIARLPFGDSDLGQAGWPLKNWPKIPWHQFIIPLKRDLHQLNITSGNMSGPCVRNCVVGNLTELIYQLRLNSPGGSTASDVNSFSPSKTAILIMGVSQILNGIYLLVQIGWSDSSRLLRSEIVKAQGLCPMELRVWIDKMGCASVQSWPSIAIWVLRYFRADWATFVVGWNSTLIGLNLLCLSLGEVPIAEKILLVSAVIVLLVWFKIAEMFLMSLWRMRRTLNKLRARNEDSLTLEDALKSAPEA